MTKKDVRKMLKTVPYADMSLLEDIVFDEMVARKIEKQMMRNTRVSFEDYLIYLVDGDKSFSDDELNEDLKNLYNDLIVTSIEKYHKEH